LKLLYVVNEARFFISHRLPLGLEALQRGLEVVVVTAPGTGEDRLATYGFRHLPIDMSRSGFNPLQELATYRGLKAIYRSEMPDLVHHVTIKPVIYGSFAARRAKVPAIVNAVPGMGYLFTRRGVWASVMRAVVNALYRAAFSGSHMRVIFQNREDMKGFIGHDIVKKEQTVLIRGSGVDLDLFDPTRPKPEVITILMVARMLRHKGVFEFARAAAEVKRQHPDWRFLLVGGTDFGNPTSLTEEQLKQLEVEYGVEWQGHSDRVQDLMADAHIVCLPYYREGVPKTLLEGAAAGRGLIASDIAGCREVITDGVTGLLVPPREVAPLAVAMLRMGEDNELRERCAQAANEKAIAVFSIDDVVEHHFRVYNELLSS
jgi:glycosyltransferase involved in cell wall biosynthesis